MSGRQRELTMRFLAEPTDVNYGGKVHGGVVMKWIDQAGYAAAVGWSGKYSVTVAVGGIRFVSPIRTSDLVTITTKLVYTGTSSMHFAVDVNARDPMGGKDRLQAFVSIGIVLPGAPYAFDMGGGFVPSRRDVAYVPAREAAIAPLLDDFEFVDDRQRWGSKFRFGLFAISDHDMRLIAQLMQAELQLLHF